MNDNTKKPLIVILLVFILGMGAWIIFGKQKEIDLNVVETPQTPQDQSVQGETYTYTNHGFSIELPNGFVPKEEINSEFGPIISIKLPIGRLAYVKDADWWEKNIINSSYKFIKDQIIGNTLFKTYDYGGITYYWYKRGNVGYEFVAVNNDGKIVKDEMEKLLTTFKFVGWPDTNEFKKISRANYSFEAPKNWNESSIDIKGCDYYSLSNNTSDGHRMAGEISIYLKSCDLAKSSSKQEVNEVQGYYIVAYYSQEDGTMPAEITETKEVYKRIVNTFTVNNSTEIQGNKQDLVSFSIKPGQEVSGKITATGSIKNGYFFEANIGVNILDSSKKRIRQGYGTATTDWMTSGPVSFKTNLDFTNLAKGKAYIEIVEDDPRDASERGDYQIKKILIPVVIK